jgi:hypothetical protein
MDRALKIVLGIQITLGLMWIMLLPIVFWFAPLIIRTMAGDYLSTQQLAAMVVLAVPCFRYRLCRE